MKVAFGSSFGLQGALDQSGENAWKVQDLYNVNKVNWLCHYELCHTKTPLKIFLIVMLKDQLVGGALPSFFWYDTTLQYRICEECSVQFFWYDNDNDLKACFSGEATHYVYLFNKFCSFLLLLLLNLFPDLGTRRARKEIRRLCHPAVTLKSRANKGSCQITSIILSKNEKIQSDRVYKAALIQNTRSPHLELWSLNNRRFRLSWCFLCWRLFNPLWLSIVPRIL